MLGLVFYTFSQSSVGGRADLRSGPKTLIGKGLKGLLTKNPFTWATLSSGRLRSPGFKCGPLRQSHSKGMKLMPI